MSGFLSVERGKLVEKLAREVAAGRDPRILQPLAEALLYTEGPGFRMAMELSFTIKALEAFRKSEAMQPHRRKISAAIRALDRLRVIAEAQPKPKPPSYLDLMSI